MTTRTPGAPRHVGSWRPARAVAWWIAFVAVHAGSAALDAAHGQLIPVKTAPISDGGQFSFLPSANLGLGGLSIALADSSLDPFVNPAKGARLNGTRVFGSPTFYSLSREAGGGLTLPLGMSNSTGPWFMQLAVAMQEVDPASEVLTPGFVALDGIRPLADVVGPSVTESSQPSRQNRFVHGMLGRRLANGMSIAGSASWWRLNAIDGVEGFYPRSQRVRQHGEAADLRLGLFKELGRGQSIEAVAVHNRFDMNQDVAFVDLFWDPNLRQMTSLQRTEPNADRTETWGLHLGYTRPLPDSTWRLGAIVTGNRILQPSLPGYDLPQVPGDASRATALNLGAGISRATGVWKMGLDAIFEPIWNNSWVTADGPAETLQGTELAAGTHTLESDFAFTNGIVRLGVAAAVPLSSNNVLTFEAGGRLHAIRYRLEQRDAIRATETTSTQQWNEWTRSWGMSLRFSNADLQYRGSLTTGARRPGFNNDVVFPPPTVTSSSFIGPFVTNFGFDKVRATTHQISLSVPIR